MPYADFHIHGSFKAYFTGNTVKEKKNPWEYVKYKVDKIMFRRYNEIFSSQSCFRQMADGDVELAIVPLYSVEHGFVGSTLLQILNLLSRNIDNTLFRRINKRKVTHYQQLIDCLDHLMTAANGNHPDAGKVNFTRSFADIKAGHINVIFSLEGAHAFLDRDEDVASPAKMAIAMNRVKDFKKKSPASPFPRIFIVNFTHLTRAPFGNHAFGIKMLNHDDFIPEGRGISLAGWKLIETALSSDVDHYPMIIDIKHMSLECRKTYYAYRRQYFPHIPIVASHAGCTGISFEQINDYILEINTPQFNKKSCNLVSWRKPDGHLPGTGYNPWSINLYDEDIVEILSSGGIIGLSLDQRILGTGKLAREKMSRAESFEGITPLRPVLGADPEEGPSIRDAELHFRHLCNNLFHIVKIGQQIEGFGNEVWNRVVIGSDFDGLIDAVDFCPTAADFKLIRVYMLQKLPALAAEARIDLPKPINNITDDLLHDNGYRFLQQWY
jgi:microsomal dipeptidase-like Zn-dependent dipeptidase